MKVDHEEARIELSERAELHLSVEESLTLADHVLLADTVLKEAGVVVLKPLHLGLEAFILLVCLKTRRRLILVTGKKTTSSLSVCFLKKMRRMEEKT